MRASRRSRTRASDTQLNKVTSMLKAGSSTKRAQRRTAHDDREFRTACENGFAYFQMKVAQHIRSEIANRAFRAMLGCGPALGESRWPMTLVELIQNRIQTDDSDESSQLRELYQRTSARKRAAIDNAFIHLCGWRLQTLIEETDRQSGRLPDCLR
jgi:hypothetical protein